MNYYSDPLIKKWLDEIRPWVEKKGPIRRELRADAPKEIVELREKLIKRMAEYREEVAGIL